MAKKKTSSGWITKSLGRIQFLRQRDGEMGVGQSWNPGDIPTGDRAVIAETLREIADAIERDEFEIDGRYVTFVPQERVVTRFSKQFGA